MTFVRAQKVDNQIIIVSDTKLTNSVTSESYLTQDNLGTGTIKSIILSDEFCMNFSGDVSYVIEALIKIDKCKDINFIIDILHEVNKKACSNGHDCEFILAFLDGSPHLIEFKNSEYEETQSSWIGSQAGFQAYQRSFSSISQPSMDIDMNEAITKVPGGYTINQNLILDEALKKIQIVRPEIANEQSLSVNIGFELHKLPDCYTELQQSCFSKMRDSIINVIEDDSIPEVGGFYVMVATQNNSFQYMPRATYLKKPINYNELTQVIDYIDNPSKKQYINFFSHSNNALAVHISTTRVGILFSKDKNSFLQPEIFYPFDEIDFSYELYRKYGIDGNFGIETNYKLFQDKAQKCYKQDPERAINYMLSGVKILEKQIRNDMNNTSSHEPLEYYCTNEYNRKAYLSQYYGNIGVCYYTANDSENAKHFTEYAISVSSENRSAHKLLAIINNEI